MAATPSVPDREFPSEWSSPEEFKASVKEWSARIRVKPARIQLRPMTGKWGSCSTQGVVTYNTELLNNPRSFGEAVIAHELIHLIVRNHGRLFKSLLRAHLSDSEDALSVSGGCGI